ncbi:MAG: DNA primase [Gracilibacteraceae bacterium]|jgi:DNA primase|nr:DNA primase [Gracilibacteraceae bacterium]
MSSQHRIPNEFIEELQQKADIVSIIADHVELRRAGRNYLGLCPFHAEKTPSFNVDTERQRYHCFGCHAGGNVFQFLMQRENLSFPDAVRRVAEKTGMEFPSAPLSEAEQAGADAAKRCLKAHAAAAAFYHQLLMKAPEGRPAREYLQSRKISEATAGRFSLGYAPDRWDALSGALQAEGFTESELVDFGLLKQREDASGSYDRFRARLMFPIFDVRGRPVAFGGRILAEEKSKTAPKYLNSPETKFFQKGKYLYGMHVACRHIGIAGFALLVEGFMDVIAVQEAGFLHAVASLGTALTRDQARLLKRHGSRVVVGYDSDGAGRQAALAAGEIFLAEGLRTEVLVLTEDKDPDEYLRGHSPEQFADLLSGSLPFIEFKFRELSRGRVLGSVTDKADVIRLLAPDIRRLSPAEQEGYERFLSRECGLTFEAVKAEVESRKTAGGRRRSPPKDRPAGEEAVPAAAKATAVSVPLGVFRAEQSLLRLALEEKSYRPLILEELGADFWLVPEHRFLFESEAGPDAYTGDDDFYRRCQKRLAELYAFPFDSARGGEIFADCLQAVKREKERKTTEELQSRMILLEKDGDMAGALALLKVIQQRLRANSAEQGGQGTACLKI